MTPRRRAIGTTLIVVPIIIVVTIGAVAFVTIDSPSGLSGTTSSTTSPDSQRTAVTSSTGDSISSSASTNGLRLVLNISQSSIIEGGGVSIQASIFNTLPTRVNLAASNGMSLSLGPCSQSPLGVDIAEGNYDAANLSEATFLNLYEPGPYFCGPEFFVSAWSFAPMSDNVTAVSLQPVGPGNATVGENMSTAPAAANLYYTGYWTGESFSSFSPGAYTLVAEDEWGQVAVLHFQDLPLTCFMVTSDPSSFVAYANYSSSPASGPLQLYGYYRQAGTNNTYLLAVSSTASTSSTLDSVHYEGPYYTWYLQYSSNLGESQSWQYLSPNGTLTYPATIAQNQCSIVRVVLPQVSAEVPLVLLMSNNETQTFTLNP